MFLCMDEFGNIYQAASHRSDGKGIEKLTETVESFGEKTFDKSAKDMASRIEREGKLLEVYNKQQDKVNEALKKKAEYHKALHKAQLENQRQIEQKLKSKMVESAIQQQMNGADFNQLSIVDAGYAKVHEAVLQNKKSVSAGDMKYIGSVSSSNPLELEQSKLQSEAEKYAIKERIQQQAFNEGAKYGSILNRSTRDEYLQKIMEGEVHFANEDEAKAFNQMTQSQQIQYLKSMQNSEKKTNILPIALAIGLGLVLIGGN